LECALFHHEDDAIQPEVEKRGVGALTPSWGTLDDRGVESEHELIVGDVVFFEG